MDFQEGLIRGLLAARNGVGVESPELETLNELVGAVSLQVGFGEDGRTEFRPQDGGGPVERVAGRLLAVVVGADADGTWGRLKACRNQGCRWAFYDGSKNHSGNWCNMDVCGARHKIRAYWRRRAETAR